MDNKKIGKTIKSIRKAKDITQEELAEKINSSPVEYFTRSKCRGNV